jgi:hypothetical protein
MPVFEVDERTPLRRVRQWEAYTAQERREQSRWGVRDSYFRLHPQFGPEVPIPDHAAADDASDAHMAIIDRAAGCVWDMWHCRRRDDGDWESYSGISYDLNGSGEWRTSDFPVKDDDSIHFHGPCRAAGVPIIAGLIMQHEILAGEIRHKLAYATWHNAVKEFVAPATWTDGFEPDGLPEGAVMQLDPMLTPEQFGLSPAGAVIFRALQRYGMVNTDNARGNTLYGEGLYADPKRSWDGILDEEEMRKLPLECFRVLEIGPTIKMGDCWPSRSR